VNTHLVWDWNGTLLNDLSLVVTSTNQAIATVDGPVLTPEQHRVAFRRPVADYYADVLGRVVDAEEFGRLDRIFHDAYRAGLTTCALAEDAEQAMRNWSGTQSLLSMWFHEELVPLVRRRRDDPLRELTPREREVLGLMAEGRSNGAIARLLVVTDGAVEKHVHNIFTKLQLPPDTEQHRRVLAVLTYLRG